jgi:hypothetical protein
MRSLAILVFTSAAAVTAAHAEQGIGIVLGQPTGVSYRMDLANSQAIDAVLAWRLGQNEYVLVHADYLWIKPKLVGPREFTADFYYGVGAILALPKDDVAAALRLPAGLSHKFSDPNLEVFTELAIAFTLVPETDFDIVGGVGLRWWW